MLDEDDGARIGVWVTLSIVALLLEWLKDIGYEQHLYDSEDSEKLAASRWTNVLDFVDWIAKRCGGELSEDAAARSVNRRRCWTWRRPSA